MKAFSSTIICAIGVFIINILLNSVTGYFSEDKGIITIGPIIHIGKDMFAQVSLSNLDREPTNGLMLSIPAKTQVTSIRASAPIKLESISNSVGNEMRKHIEVSAVESSRVTVLMMPIETKEDLSLISAINERQIRYSVESYDNVHSWLRVVMYKALFAAGGTALLYAGLLWYLEHRNQVLNSNVRELKSRLEEVAAENNQRYDNAMLEVKQATDTSHRVKIFYMNRASNLSKELDFWRDTIRKVLYKTDGKDVDTLLSDVRGHLKTYSNDLKAMDFETIEALAKSMNANTK